MITVKKKKKIAVFLKTKRLLRKHLISSHSSCNPNQSDYVLLYIRALSQEHTVPQSPHGGRINETAALIYHFFELKGKISPFLSRSFMWWPSISTPPQTEAVRERARIANRVRRCADKLLPLTLIHLYPVYTLKNLLLISLKRKLKPWGGVMER